MVFLENKVFLLHAELHIWVEDEIRQAVRAVGAGVAAVTEVRAQNAVVVGVAVAAAAEIHFVYMSVTCLLAAALKNWRRHLRSLGLL